MLTNSQRRKNYRPLADKVAAFIKREGCGPTVRDISRMHGGNGSPGHGNYLVEQLAKAGYITKTDQPRSIEMAGRKQ
jgi:ribosomal protein S19E (S16A)